MIFLNYCFYRIANVYKFWLEDSYYITARGIVALCEAMNVLFMFSIVCIVFNKKYTLVFAGFIIILFCLINIFYLTEKKYIQLQNRWKNENLKYKRLKGYLVILYILLSFGAYIYMYAKYDVLLIH